MSLFYSNAYGGSVDIQFLCSPISSVAPPGIVKSFVCRRLGWLPVGRAIDKSYGPKFHQIDIYGYLYVYVYVCTVGCYISLAQQSVMLQTEFDAVNSLAVFQIYLL